MAPRKLNITLSADAELVRRTREYAAAHHTTLNQLVRDHMEQLTGTPSREDAASEFERLARTCAGRSPEDYRLDRDALHDRQA
ncbi:MAG: hypothetical protein ABIL09_09210 [Gemmatimonadota bacterium]